MIITILEHTLSKETKLECLESQREVCQQGDKGKEWQG